MPIHEYACDDCGERFEQLVRSDTVPACPRCGSQRLARQLSVFATASAGAAAQPGPAFAGSMPGPCGACGHPAGPGSCSLQ